MPIFILEQFEVHPTLISSFLDCSLNPRTSTVLPYLENNKSVAWLNFFPARNERFFGEMDPEHI